VYRRHVNWLGRCLLRKLRTKWNWSNESIHAFRGSEYKCTYDICTFRSMTRFLQNVFQLKACRLARNSKSGFGAKALRHSLLLLAAILQQLLQAIVSLVAIPPSLQLSFIPFDIQGKKESSALVAVGCSEKDWLQWCQRLQPWESVLAWCFGYLVQCCYLSDPPIATAARCMILLQQQASDSASSVISAQEALEMTDAGNGAKLCCTDTLSAWRRIYLDSWCN